MQRVRQVLQTEPDDHRAALRLCAVCALLMGWKKHK